MNKWLGMVIVPLFAASAQIPFLLDAGPAPINVAACAFCVGAATTGTIVCGSRGWSH